MKIEDIKNKDLIYFGERIEPFFASSIIIRGMLDKKNLGKILGWKTGVRWLYTNNYFFIKKDDLVKVQVELKNKFKKQGAKYAKNLIVKCFDYADKLISTSKKIEKEVLASSLDKKKMRLFLAKYSTVASNYMIFQNIALFEESIYELAHEVVSKYHKNNKEIENVINLISASNKLTTGEREQDDFLKLCANKDCAKLASRHARTYGWLSIRFFVGEPWTKDDVLVRMKNISPMKAIKEIKKRIEHRNLREERIKSAIKDFSKQDKELVQLIRSIVFLRTQRTDFFQESSCYVQGLVRKIAKELGVSYEDLLYLSATEVILALDGKFNYISCIRKRKSGFLVFFDNNRDIILEDSQAISYIRKRPILDRENKTITELKGNIGFMGVARGKVKIIKSDKDNEKVKKGDIIVAVMTTFNFIPAMEKATAFVTDEGGITCHAAIIAREMEKPCMIGTKVATKLLKDGDLIEVDANKGKITILKKAN